MTPWQWYRAYRTHRQLKVQVAKWSLEEKSRLLVTEAGRALLTDQDLVSLIGAYAGGKPQEGNER